MKIMNHVLVLLTLLFVSEAISQSTTFEYTFKTINDDRVFDIYENSEGDIIFCGGTSKTPDFWNSSLLVAKIDSNGNELNSNIYSIDNKSIYAKQILLYDTLVLVANISDTLLFHPSIGLYNVDYNLNLTNGTIYSFNPDFLFWDTYSLKLNNGNILTNITLRQYPNLTWRTHNYVFNSDFDSIYSKYYPDLMRPTYHMKELPNSNIWSLNMVIHQYELFDSSLNIINTQKVPELLTGNYGVGWDSDSSFFLLGKDVDQFSGNGQNLAFIRQYHPMDTSNYLFNYWRYSDTCDFPAIWNGVDLNKKDSVYIGGTENMDFYSPWYGNQPSWFVVIQTDSLLNIRWERFYGGDAYYNMTNLIASNDGGCIVAGTRYDYQNAPDYLLDITILKLDSEGLITSVNEDIPEKFSEAIVFPNPGYSQLNVRIASQYSESTFELFELNGTKVLHKDFFEKHNILNTEGLKSGSYIYQITNDIGLKESGIWIKK